MSQHDFNIANQGFPATREDINNALAALASSSSGTSEPSTTYAGQVWNDTTNNLLKFRNDANDAWITLAKLDQATNEWEVRSSVFQAVDSAGIAFKTDDGTTRLTIDSSGDVIIGATSVVGDETLRVNGSLRCTSDGAGVGFYYAGAFRDVGGAGNSYIDLNSGGSAGNIIFRNGSGLSEMMRIDSSGDVGIGTSSPAVKLDVDGGDIRTTNRYLAGSTGASTPDYSFASDGSMGMFRIPGSLGFATGGTERARIDSSGNLLVGTTDPLASISSAVSATGVSVYQGSQILVTNSSNVCGQFNRTVSDGPILNFAKNGTTVGSIGVVVGDNLYIGSTAAGHSGIGFGSNEWTPMSPAGTNSDNAINLGASSRRFNDVYATNGTIQTSDRNEKQDIEELSDAETRVAQACKGLLRKFRWIDAVEEKGDNARTHFGIIAQDLRDAFTAEGLDAGDYAMFISTTWWEHEVEVPAVEYQAATYGEDGELLTEEVEAQDAYTRTDTYDTEEEAPEGSVERTRLGVRYPELLAFMIAAL